MFILCSFLTHIYFAFLSTGAQLLLAHLWSLIGRLILLSVSSATCWKHQTDWWSNARITKHLEGHNVALQPDVPGSTDSMTNESIICFNNMLDCEWWKRWKPSPHYVERAMSHRTSLQATLLVQGWGVSAFPHLRSQSYTVSLLMFAQGRESSGRNVHCVYSGRRAVSWHHAYRSTQFKLYVSMVLSQERGGSSNKYLFQFTDVVDQVLVMCAQCVRKIMW